MSEKVIQSRIVQKHDTEANWIGKTTFVPKQGEIIVYDIDSNYNYERIKIGDGKTVVSSLPFIDDHALGQLETVKLQIQDLSIDGGTYRGNLDNAEANKVYWCALANCTNGPQSSGYGFLEVWTGLQRFTVYNTGDTYMRAYANDAWNDWQVVNEDKFVPASRTVNGKALSSNISLSANDVGAAPINHIHKSVSNPQMNYVDAIATAEDESICPLNTTTFLRWYHPTNAPLANIDGYAIIRKLNVAPYTDLEFIQSGTGRRWLNTKGDNGWTGWVEKGTLEDIGAAPAGYGLGETEAKILNSNNDLNTVSKSGWYFWSESAPTNAPVIKWSSSYGYMRVDGRSANEFTQTVWSAYGDANGLSVTRSIINGTPTDWMRCDPSAFTPATEVQASYTLATSAELDSTLSSVFSSLANGTAKTIHIIYNNTSPIGQGDWFMTVRRAGAEYSTVEAIHDSATGVQKKYRSYYGGAWTDWVDIPSHTHNNYLPLSGGTLTGEVTAPRFMGILGSTDTRDQDLYPNEYGYAGMKLEFKQSTTVGIPEGTYTYVATYQPWGDVVQWSGGKATQMAFGDSGNVYIRKGNGSGWDSWRTLLSSDNYSSYCLPLSGGNLTGSLWLTAAGAERDLGIEYASGKSLYLYANSSTGGRGLHDTTNGTIISVANGANTFYGNATTATAATTADIAATVRGVYTHNGGAQPPSYIGHATVRFNMMNQYKGLSNLPTYADCILMDTYDGGDVPYVTSLGIIKSSAARAFIAVGAKGNTTTWIKQAEIITDSNYSSYAVPLSRTVNGKALTGNISLTYSDVGAAAASHNHSAANITSGTLPIARGGTGATDADHARSSLQTACSYNIGDSPSGYDGVAWGWVLTNYHASPSAANSWGDGYYMSVDSTGVLRLGRQLNQATSITWSKVYGENNKPTAADVGALAVNGNAVSATYASILKPTDNTSTTTVAVSDWVGNTSSGKIVWREKFTNSSLGTDNGAILFWLASNTAAGGVGLNVTIDGQFYQNMDKVVLDSGNYSSYCAPASHTHSYLPLSGGTLTGTTIAAATAVGTNAIRNIHGGTSALTAGSSALTTGSIYVQYV